MTTIGGADTGTFSVVLPNITLGPDPLDLVVGQQLDLTLGVPPMTPEGSFDISLADEAIASAPPSVLLPAGASSVSVPVTGLATGATSVTASRPGFEPATVMAIVQPLAPPTISSMNRNAALAGEIVAGFTVRGENLIGATFAASPAGITVSNVVLLPSGCEAQMTLTVDGAATGTFVVTATNAAGSSPTVADPPGEPVNTIELIDAVGDSDGDGLNNEDELNLGSDPFDAHSFPVNVFAAAPPEIRVVRPLTDQLDATELNVFVAMPPRIRVIRPFTEHPDSTELNVFVAAPPRIRVIRPVTEQVNSTELNVFVAGPPRIRVIRPLTDQPEVSELNVFVAKPPVIRVRPFESPAPQGSEESSPTDEWAEKGKR